MRNDNKLECKGVDLYARDSQNLLSVVLSDPVEGRLFHICSIWKEEEECGMREGKISACLQMAEGIGYGRKLEEPLLIDVVKN